MRYLPLTNTQRTQMLQKIGVRSEMELYSSIPAELLHREPLNLPHAHSEWELQKVYEEYGRWNHAFPLHRNFAGAGAYSHHIPSVVDHLSLRGEFLTAYTPYQPEISQGTLQTIYEFQTMMTRILDTEFCNASHYDGATATAEACLMALRIKPEKKTILYFGEIHPMTKNVIRTYMSHLSDPLLHVPNWQAMKNIKASDVAAILVQQPDFFGRIQDLRDVFQWAQQNDCLSIVSTPNPTAFGVFAPPREADLIAGDATSLGNPPQMGGPYVGFLAGKLAHVRQAPGRLIGQTKDSRGRTVYTITLATREQHIRREKATSNICTSAGLCMTRATIHLAMLGETGFQALSRSTTTHALQFRDQAKAKKITLSDSDTHYQEFCVQTPIPANHLVEKGLQEDILLGVPLSRLDHSLDPNKLLVCLNETHDDAALDHWFRTWDRVQS